MTSEVGVVIALTLLAIGIVFTVFFVRGLRRGPRGRGEVSDRFLAVAVCQRCGTEYETEWIPGVSFSAVRAGLDRYQRCRACHELAWAHFERWAPASPGSTG